MIKEKANIAVFISGRGTNLKALILRSNKKTCNYKIAYVISNKKNAAGLKIAKKNKIITKVISQSCLLYTSPRPRDRTRSRMPCSA